MIYYIILIDKQTNETQFIEHYDAFSKELITTLYATERQEYLSKDSLLEELINLLDDKDVFDAYDFQIGGY